MSRFYGSLCIYVLLWTLEVSKFAWYLTLTFDFESYLVFQTEVINELTSHMWEISTRHSANALKSSP